MIINDTYVVNFVQAVRFREGDAISVIKAQKSLKISIKYFSNQRIIKKTKFRLQNLWVNEIIYLF